MRSYVDVFGEEAELSEGFFRELALLKYLPLGINLVTYLEMLIKRDLQALIQIPPKDTEGVAQLQARIDANGRLRALITVDETIYALPDEQEEK